MSRIFIVAGPPGIGKSTTGYKFLPDDIAILDADHIAQRYKKKGDADYKEMGEFRFNQLLKKSLFSEEEFAIELNLGFQSHYDLVKQIKRFNSDNTLHVILYFTDHIELCKNRAAERHQSGLHLVTSEIIGQMYRQTIPLLSDHFKLFDELTLVDMPVMGLPEICGSYTRGAKQVKLHSVFPDWASSLNETLKKQLKPRGPHL